MESIIFSYKITIVTPEAHSVGDAKQLINSYTLKKQVHFTGQGESPIFVLDGKTNECVHCETVELCPRKRRITMDMEVFKKHADVQIRNDLIDCQVDMCSVEVPALFTESF
ncbi:4095_t:CDS:2 [Cetraspora pellucida]|uniref:4095_t:CDS:1 n=1 Tax=Cetraspora pellucida TaxID=1433469 RepID=A0A9N9C8T5_9GLOM|nr:4095_t:CDS:2 [Cetraspora pellucida]